MPDRLSKKIEPLDVQVISEHVRQRRDVPPEVEEQLKMVIKGAWWNNMKREKRRATSLHFKDESARFN